jgi:hypothetical protein
MQRVGQSHHKKGVERRVRNCHYMLAALRRDCSKGDIVVLPDAAQSAHSFSQDCLRSDSMLPMHQDLSFSSLVSEITPSVRGSGFRTPCCRGRSVATSSRTPGRIGDIIPDSWDLAFLEQSLEQAEAEPLQNQKIDDVPGDDGVWLHSLEMDIVRIEMRIRQYFLTTQSLTLHQEIVDGSIGVVLQDICQRVQSITMRCISQLGHSFRLAIHGPIHDVECAVSLLRLHSQKIRQLEDRFTVLTGSRTK